MFILLTRHEYHFLISFGACSHTYSSTSKDKGFLIVFCSNFPHRDLLKKVSVIVVPKVIEKYFLHQSKALVWHCSAVSYFTYPDKLQIPLAPIVLKIKVVLIHTHCLFKD